MFMLFRRQMVPISAGAGIGQWRTPSRLHSRNR
jgi:hypothetical protein